ncbi:MAG: GNAT family N-acetyltransferase [Thermoplasmata archaeon]
MQNPEDMDRARSIRLRVFVREQNVPMEIEMDEYDAVAIHMVCLLDGRVVGTGRLVQMPDGMKLGRVAILREHRGKGLGTGIVRWLLGKAMESGAKSVYANVQIGAMEFYEKLGFRSSGGIFMEANIEHIKMVLDI